jgi:hypothetical protein
MFTWLNNLKRNLIKDKSDVLLFVVILFFLSFFLVIFSEYALAQSNGSEPSSSFFKVLPLKQDIDLVSLFSGTLIIIALIERSIELLLPIFRAGKNENTPEEKKAHETERRKTALKIGLIIGFFASLVGIRILEPLVEIEDINNIIQLIGFRLFDIIFSTMGIATGSELFHIFPSLTSSVLGSAKEQSEANIESAKLQKEEFKLERMPKEVQNKELEKEIETIERDTKNIRLEKKQQELASAQRDNQLRREKIESLRIEQEEISQESITADLSEDQPENPDSNQ